MSESFQYLRSIILKMQRLKNMLIIGKEQNGLIREEHQEYCVIVEYLLS